MQIVRKKLILFLSIGGIMAIFLFLMNIHRKTLNVKTHTVTPGNVEDIVSSLESGILEPVRRARLRAETTGTILKILKNEGERVTKGEAIIKFNSDEPKTRMEIQKSNLEMLEARFEIIKVNLENFNKRLEKLRKLYSEGGISENQIEDAETQLRSTESEVIAAEAGVRQAQAVLELARIELSKTVLSAPFDGIITEINARIGEVPSGALNDISIAPLSSQSGLTMPSLPSGNYLCEIIDDSSFYVEARFDEIDALKIKTGNEAMLSSDALPERNFKGVVNAVSPAVSGNQDTTRSVTVKIVIKNTAEDMLLAGMSFDVDVIVHSVGNVLVIPTNTIIERKGEQFVYVLNGKRVKEIAIKSGITNWEWTEVRNGLKKGDKVITSLEIKDLKPGARAREENGTTD